MQPIAWIICETEPHWTPSLRRHFARRSARPDGCLLDGFGPAVRITEARGLGDVSRLLADCEDSFVVVEVRRDTLGKVLSWLSQTGRRYPATRFAALLDRSLFDVPDDASGEAIGGRATGGEQFSVRSGSVSHQERRIEIEAALREAGAVDSAASLRELHRILSAGLRHAWLVALQRARAAESLPFIDQVWASLPWEAQKS